MQFESVYIPYGAYWSTPFTRWQGSFAELHPLLFAADVTKRALREHDSPAIRVNAIAPGFFLTDQNRYLMVDAHSGAMTPRGQAIVDHTPMGRLGTPEDLPGTLLWLVSPASAFVTGVVIPVDGGFSCFSGV